MENDRCFWYPFRPDFRWPMRVLGVALALGIMAEGMLSGRWRWESLFLPTAFIIWSFQTPVRRLKSASYYLGLVIFWGLVLAAGVLVWWLRA